MEFWSSGYGTAMSSRVENKLETIDSSLSNRKIEHERAAVIINFRVNERRTRSNGRGCYVIHKIANTPHITNIEEAGFGNI